MTTVYVSIGNSDDKLSQAEWARYVEAVDEALADQSLFDGAPVEAVHGVWFSLPNSRYQNACWCVEVVSGREDELKGDLRDTALEHKQESIAWMAGVTEFL